jgi:hypothetical protein
MEPCRADSEGLRSSLDLFVKELRSGKPGSALSVKHLAQLMLIQMLRLYLDSTNELEPRGLSAQPRHEIRVQCDSESFDMCPVPSSPWSGKYWRLRAEIAGFSLWRRSS